MLGQNLPEYVFVRLSIFFLRLVTPLSAAYVAFLAVLRPRTLLSFSGFYAIAEVSFYICVFLPRLKVLQKVPDDTPRLSALERRNLFDRCLECMTGVATSGWFRRNSIDPIDLRIRRDNIVDWLLWSLFSTDTLLEEWEDEMDYYLSFFGGVLGYDIDSGKNPNMLSIRLSIDPVLALHRPLIWYMIVGFVDTITSISMFCAGFRHYDNRKWFCVFPPRPLLTLVPGGVTESELSYWYRPHRSEDKHPILFLHGIGIGLWPYRAFLKEITEQNPDVGILAVEILPISMHISAAPLSRNAMCRTVERILSMHDISYFTVAAHSYGTVLAAFLHHDVTLSSRIKGSLLIDPIPFLLHHSSVAYNFLYRSPRMANEWQLWYFASRDPDIARVLGRHFHWFEGILFREELFGKRVTVSLSGRDQIVDARSVHSYLTGESEPASRWEKEGLEVLFFAKLDHAMVFDTKPSRDLLSNTLGRLLAK